MTQFYGELMFSLYDENQIKPCLDIINNIGEAIVKRRKDNTISIRICTPIRNITDLDILTDELYDMVFPYKEKIKIFLNNNTKVKCRIYFVKMSAGCDAALGFTKKFIELAYDLDARIDFDGF